MVFGADKHAPALERNAEDGDTIVSAIRRGDAALASTRTGLYQGSVPEKTWRKLDAPPEMKPGGKFIQQDPASPVAGYFFWESDPGDRGKRTTRIFVSKDEGKTWTQTSAGRQFIDVYVHPDGTFYAIEYEAPKDDLGRINMEGKRSVVSSQDLGATWKDASGDMPPDTYIENFFRDPENPGAICVVGGPHTGLDSGRYTVYEAADKNYHWVAKAGSTMMEEGYKHARLEFGWASGSSEQYQTPLKRTLSNYFIPESLNREDERSFCNFAMFGSSIPAMQMAMEKTVYTFRKDSPKIIPVKIEFLAERPQAQLDDTKDGTMFWWVDMVTYGREPFGWSPPKKDVDMLKKIASRAGDSLLVKLDPRHPYEKDVDISKLHDFSKPGIYRIQLRHSDEWLAPWGGEIVSPVIDVTITE
jgi:hypothetical protein